MGMQLSDESRTTQASDARSRSRCWQRIVLLTILAGATSMAGPLPVHAQTLRASVGTAQHYLTNGCGGAADRPFGAAGAFLLFPEMPLIKRDGAWLPATFVTTTTASTGSGESTFVSVLSAAGIVTTTETGALGGVNPGATISATMELNLNTEEFKWCRTILSPRFPPDIQNRVAKLPVTLTPIVAGTVALSAVAAQVPEASPGGAFGVSDVVTNTSTTGVSVTPTIRYFLDPTPERTATSIPLTGSRIVPTLSPGQSHGGSIPVIVPPATPEGDYYVVACADGPTILPISNCAASGVTIEIRKFELTAADPGMAQVHLVPDATLLNLPVAVGAVADGVTTLVLRIRTSEPTSILLASPSDGALGRLDPGVAPTLAPGPLALVPPRTINGTPYVFALFRAPAVFSTTPGTQAKRTIRLTARTVSGAEDVLEIDLHRPPLLLLHGFWSDRLAWLTFAQRIRAAIPDPAYKIRLASIPNSNERLFSIAAAAALFTEFDNLKARMRADGVAVSKVDVVTKSTGALNARVFAAQLDMLGATHFNRIITIAAPHCGSFLADLVRGFRNTLGLVLDWIFVQAMRTAGRPVDGTLPDLETTSTAIATLLPVRAPTHVLVGDPLDVTLPGNPGFYFFPPFEAYMVTKIGGAGPNDGVVTVASQTAGFSDPTVYSHRYFHQISFADSEDLVVENTPDIAAHVKSVLDADPVGSPLFAPGFGPGNPCRPPAAPVVATAAMAGVDLETARIDSSATIDPPATLTVTTEASTAAPGATITVQVETSSTPIDSVILTSLAGVTLDDSAPFEVTLTVPNDFAGPLEFFAAATGPDESWQWGQASVLVVPTSAPLTIEVDPDTFHLVEPGASIALAVRGTYTGDVVRTIGAAILSTTYQSSDPSIAAVDTNGLVTALQPGTVTITVSNGSATAAAIIVVRDPAGLPDGDGLDDAWERAMGLDPTLALGDNGPFGDPDGDGLTNAEEFAAGSHPRGFFTRYLAEGATSDFFDMRLALLNPGDVDTTATLTFTRGNGQALTHAIAVPARTRVTLDPKSVHGLEAAEFSARVESDQPLVIDRTMSWNAADGYGSHAETAAAAPSPIWYLAEGATHSGFDLFYLLQNPAATATPVRVRYLLPSGAPLDKTYTLPPTSRTNIWVNLEQFDGLGRALAAADVSAVLESLDGTPIIVERAMYLSRPGGAFFDAGHASIGIAAPATTWFLAEGATGPYFDLFVLIANPTDEPAQVTVTYLLGDGTTYSRALTAPANSRSNIWVDLEEIPGVPGFPLADVAVSTTVTSTNGVPLIVERAMWWPGVSGTWHEAHSSAGSTVTGTRWALAEGEDGGPRSTETYILIANTSAFAGSATVTLLFEDGTSEARVYTLPPNSRTNVPVRHDFGAAVQDKRFGAIVESTGTTPAQIVVERAMYSNAGGVTWAAGTNALATRLP